MRTLALLLALMCAVSPVATAQGDVTALIPANAAVVVYIPSWTSLEAKVRSMGDALDQKSDTEEMIADISGNLGPIAAMIDRSKPIVICVPAPEDMSTRPEPIVMLPLLDAAKGTEAGLTVCDGYACMSDSGEFTKPAASSRLGKGIPAGDLVVRLDMTVVWQAVSSALEMGMGDMISEMMAEGMQEGISESGLDIDADEMVDKMMKGVTTFLSSSDTFDFVLGMKGGSIDVDTALLLKKDSALMKGRTLSQSLASKAKLLPASHPIHMLMSADWNSFYQMSQTFLTPMLQQLGEEEATAMKSMLAEQGKLYALMGNDMAMSMDFGNDGMEMAGFIESKDPKGYMAAMKSVMDKMSGLEGMGGQMPKMAMTSLGEIGGVEATTMTMTFPDEMLEQMGGKEQATQMMDMIFGKGGFRMNTVAAGNTIVMSMGAKEKLMALAASTTAGTAGGSPVMKRILSKAGSTPAFLMAADARQAAISVFRLAAKMGEEVPDLSKVPAVPMGAYGGPDANGYRMGFTLDAGAAKKLGEILEKH